MAAADTGCNDLCWMIGGPQGTGVDSSATLFARCCTEAGYWVYGRREYHSNIKGEHSYFQVRVKQSPVRSHIDPVHLLATFEPSTAELHAFEVVEDGALIYDPKLTDPATLDLKPGVLKVPLDFDGILDELSKQTGKPAPSLAIMKNTIAVAASMALLGIELNTIEEALKGIFAGKKESLIAMNFTAAKLAYDKLLETTDVSQYAYRLAACVEKPAKGSRMLMNGANSAALGKLKAGCRYQTYYSITPAVDECIYLESQSRFGIVVAQCEDELAAINMAIGAATTGARASTSTSGPGFCLMTEGMGWAGINEVPVVVYLYQRGGPSTGLPTRNEQGDMLFALHAGHGEYPKILIAPGDTVEQFHDSFDCFNYADRYQTPVILLSDKSIANNSETIEPFDESGLKIDRGSFVGAPDDFPKDGNVDNYPMEKALAKFERFKIADNYTENPISPRSFPGTPGRIFWLTGDEHTEFGHITEKPEIRQPMHEKRMKKLDLAAKEIPQDKQYLLYGPKNADITIVSWGSTKGVILDALPLLQEHGVNVNFLQIRLLNPFPTDAVKEILEQSRIVVGVENNYTHQLSQLIRMRTGFEVRHQISKWTGRPISETELVSAVMDIQQSGTKQVVLNYGL